MKLHIIETKNDLTYHPKYTNGTILQYTGETDKSSLIRDSYFLKNQYYIIKKVHESYLFPTYSKNNYWTYDISPISKGGKIYKRDMCYQSKAIDEMSFIKIEA